MQLISVLVCMILPCFISADDKNYLKFPKGFKIGTASSAYQIEGGWNIADKGLSNWDEFTHLKSHLISDRSNGDIACDSLNKYKQDVEIIKKAGFNHYRLSLSFSRILPNGFANKVSQAGLDYYKNVIDELHANGIEPVVTLYHWDHPVIFDKMGGWLNELMVDYFADYARIVFRELGSRVKIWSTINEPSINCNHGFKKGDFSPGLQMPGIGPYICGHNMLKAHARAYHIYDQEFRSFQKGQIGIVLNCDYFFSINKSDSMSAETAYQFDCGQFANPIFSKNGDYPQIMKERIAETSKLQGYPRSRLPEFSSEWIHYIKGTYDYFGLNHYSSNMVQTLPKNDKIGWYKDSGILQSANKSWVITPSGNMIVPHGFSELLRKINKKYQNPPVYILENGIAGYGNETDLNDYYRIDFYYSYIKEMLIAINRDGCNVKKFTAWSIMDNFEWSSGYTSRFGIVYVNFTDPNRTRIPRLSYYWLSHIINKQKLVSLDEFIAH